MQEYHNTNTLDPGKEMQNVIALAYHVSGSHTNNVLIGTIIEPNAEDTTGKWKAAAECPVLCCLTPLLNEKQLLSALSGVA